MTAFVLVHGACHGAWCWRRVSRRLLAAGHEVFTPTLTGVGERAHLLTPAVGLTTMIQDVVAVIEAEELNDVVLVGHSFGALVVLGVADRMARRLRELVLLDGVVVERGQCGFDIFASDVVTQREADAARFGSGLGIPPPPAAHFGVRDPGDAAWVERHLTAHPVRSYRDRLETEHGLGNGLPVRYLRCTDPAYSVISSSQLAVRRHGWPIMELPTGHDAMITAPDLLVAQLCADQLGRA
jgi:pimeloyl-ACP methyl ester carboxylesterase